MRGITKYKSGRCLGAVGLALNVVGSLIWGGEMRGITKYKSGRCLGLRWPPFSSHDATTN
jgi:hypothetical protein